MRIKQIPLLWTAVVALALIQVLGLGGGPDPEPAGSPEGDCLRRLEQRVARIETESGESAERPSLATTRTPVERTGDLESRIARLEERVRRLEEARVHDEAPRDADPGLHRKLNAAIARGDDEAVWQAALDAVQEDAARTLLERGADPEAVDKNGESALIWAAFNGCDRVVEHLLASRVSVDFRAHDGATALTDAARRGHLDIVRRLLAHGADVSSRDKAGRTALTHALDAGHDAIAELLRRYGAVR